MESQLNDREIMANPVAVSKPAAQQDVAVKPPQPKRRRWLNRGLCFIVILGICCWFAPIIIATTELRNRLPKLLVPNYTGEVVFGELSLNWTSPVVVKNFHVRDEDGHDLLEVAQISTSETLWQIVTRPGNIGTIKVVDPVIHVSLSDSDSNVERALAKLIGRPLTAPSSEDSNVSLPSSKSALGFVVEIDNAQIDVEHPGLKRQASINPISVRLAISQGALDEFDLTIGNPPTSRSDQTATDWLAFHYGNPPDEKPSSHASPIKLAALRAAHWSLARLNPLAPRIAPKAEFEGELNADSSVALTSTESGLDWHWEGTISIEGLIIAGIDALKSDKLALQKVEFSGQAAATEGHLAMQNLKLATDVGEFTATGDFLLDSHSQKSSMELVQSLLSDEDYHLQGQVDLKKLAALLPQTLRIREGIEITSGDVKVQFVGVAVDGVRKWSGVAGIVGLSALNAGKTVTWDKPIATFVNAHREHDTIVMDRLECRSEFLLVKGSGTLDDAKFQARGDLSKLLVNIERFVDLGIEELSGQMEATGELKRNDNTHVALTSDIALNDFAYVLSKDNVWREQHLELTVTANFQTDSHSTLTSADTGEVHLHSGGDTLDLILQNPVDLKSPTSAYSANAKLKGSLASWQDRIRPFVTLNGWRLAGNVNLTTTLTMDSRHVDVNEMALSLQQLQVSGPDWLIEDPELKFAASGQWDRKSQKWKSPKLHLAGKALTMDVADLEFGLGPKGQHSLTGTASYRADLTQLSNWKNLAIKNPSYYLIGTMNGTASVTQRDGLLVGDLDAQVEKFIVAGQGTGPNSQPQWVALWKEPLVKLTGKCSFNGSTDQMSLDSSRVEVNGLSLGANGKLEHCSTQRRIDLTGDLTYDWDLLTKRLSPQLAQQVQLSGKDHRPFSIKGSLVAASTASAPGSGIPASSVSFRPGSNNRDNPVATVAGLVDLSGQAGIGWTVANLYGFKGGAGDVSTQIERGVCRFAPLDLVVNDGKLHVTPTIYLDRDPYTLVLPQEKLVDQLTLTPEMCSNSMRFVAPMLADSAQVDGKISVDTQGASLPLSAPATGSADGVLTIHRAQAKPGPTSLQIVQAINQVRTILTRKQSGDPNRDQVWIEMTEQQVPIKLAQGRVYHQGMTFTVATVTVKTSGSVGLDNTLNLVAEIAVKDEWLGNNKTLAGLKGKTIQIPITGTTSRPQVDPNAFAELAKQIGGAAIDGLLEDKVGGDLKGVINNGLDQLLRGKK